MKTMLAMGAFFFLLFGLARCIVMIIYNFWLYREFHQCTRQFNSQYKNWRVFLRKDMTSRQIYNKLRNDPKKKEKIFTNKKVCIFYTRKKYFICKDTKDVREYLAKAGKIVENLYTKIQEPKVVIGMNGYEKITSENFEFIKELQEILEQKGEVTYEVEACDADTQ